MSEFTENTQKRTEALTKYIQGLIKNKDGKKLIDKYEILSKTFEPLEVIYALDNIMKTNHDIEIIKTASNKLFNILYKNLSSLNTAEYSSVPFLNILVKDNAGIKTKLAQTRELIKQINKGAYNKTISEITNSFNEILKFTEHYKVM